MPTKQEPPDLGADLLSSVIARAKGNSIIVVQVGNNNHAFLGCQRETERLKIRIEALNLKIELLEEMNSQLIQLAQSLRK